MEDAIQSLVSPSTERRQSLILEQLRKENVEISTKDPDLAFLIEFAVTALFGTMGIGYLYSGLGVFGLTRLVAYWLVIIFIFVFFAACPLAICLAIPLLPIHVLLAFVSANDLKTVLRRAQSGDFGIGGTGGAGSTQPRGTQVIDTPPLDPLAAFERELATERRQPSEAPVIREDPYSGVESDDLEIDPYQEDEAEAETIAEVFEGAGDAYSTVEDGDRDADFNVDAARTRLEAAAAEHEAEREIDWAQEREAEAETIAEALEETGDSPFATGEDGDRDSDLDVEEVRHKLEDADEAHHHDESNDDDERGVPGGGQWGRE